MEKVTKNIYVETGFRGCNTSFVVTGDGAVLIDTPMVPAEAKKWAAEIAKQAVLKYVINTEPHTDHAAGNCWFGGELVSHEGTRQAVSEAKVEELSEMLKWMAPDALPLDSTFSYRLATITFNRDLNLYLGGRTFQLLNTPGHTPSETAVFVPEERIVFTGDTLNLNMPIFVQSLPYEWLASLKRIQQLEADIIVPGHGPVSDKTAVAKMSDVVQYWIDAVKTAIDKGWSVEETLLKVTLEEKHPGAVKNAQTVGLMKMSIGNLYHLLKK